MSVKPISINFFTPGMEIDFKVYNYVDNNLVLLCENCVLTERMLLSIKKTLGENVNVYVEENVRNHLIADTDLYEDNERLAQAMIGYDRIKEETGGIINEAFKIGKVSKRDIENISGSIFETVLGKNDNIIFQCINSTRTYDEYLYTHSMNVALINGLMGKWLKYDEEQIANLVKTGFAHDLGKTRIPLNILNKPEELTPEEFEMVKNHPKDSVDMLLKAGERDQDMLMGVYQHHEKANGTGYPEGLNTVDISEFGKITAISDVYDAMVSEKYYREAQSPFIILEELAKCFYSQLDMGLTVIFLERMPQELVGKYVLLSDGSLGKIKLVDPNQLRYPLVSVGDEIIKTNDKLFVKQMYMPNK